MSSENHLQSEPELTIKQARDAGLLIEAIPLSQIDATYLMRDRLVQDEDEMASLKSSLKSRGQQMPIEVTRMGDTGRFGLISGWRRLTALRSLYTETREPRFARVRAMIVQPDTAEAAYLAMIEENEIRVNLSHYERARIALRAVHEGIFPDQRTALRGLYSSTTRSKRSKIGTFMSLVQSFDGVLQHPTAISEKLGLALARELVRDSTFADRLSDILRKAPLRTASEETRLISQALSASTSIQSPETVVGDRPASRSARRTNLREEQIETVKVRYHPDQSRLDVSGEGVDETLFADLTAWLQTRLAGRGPNP